MYDFGNHGGIQWSVSFSLIVCLSYSIYIYVSGSFSILCQMNIFAKLKGTLKKHRLLVLCESKHKPNSFWQGKRHILNSSLFFFQSKFFKMTFRWLFSLENSWLKLQTCLNSPYWITVIFTLTCRITTLDYWMK